ncbi:hypothetical protein CR513_23592, partial [Mucuna pruriens]
MLPPCIFGSVTFVHLHKNQRIELDPCALRCIFLGYTTHQKGYCCYHPTTKCIYITMDVTFLDFEIYFSALTCNYPLQREIQNYHIHIKAFVYQLSSDQVPSKIQEA